MARPRELDRSGVIKGYRARLDWAKPDAGFVAYATAGLNSHTKVSQPAFERAMIYAPEGVDCHNITGTLKCRLCIEVADLPAYKAFHTDEQTIQMIKGQEAGKKTADVRRRCGISQGAVCKDKIKYGGMTPSDPKKLCALEAERAKLKKLLAEQRHDNAMLRYVTAQIGNARCQAEDDGSSDGSSSGAPASGVFCAESRSIKVRYQSRAVDDGEVRDAIERVSKDRRVGHGRICVLVRRESFEVNHKKPRY